MNTQKYVTISGSFQKFAREIKSTRKSFIDVGVNVLSPASGDVVSAHNGFVSMKGDVIPRIDTQSMSNISRAIRLVEDSHLYAIAQSDVLWLVLPDGYCGTATSAEIAWALAHHVPVYGLLQHVLHSKEPLVQAYVNPVRTIEDLVMHQWPCIREHLWIARKYSDNIFLKTYLKKSEENTATNPNAVVAVGALIEDWSDKKYKQEQSRDVLLVKTHKWGGRFSIVGGRIKKGEELVQACLRKVNEQTQLYGEISKHVCAFSEIPNGGYFVRGTNRVFIDTHIKVYSRIIHLDEEAQHYEWIPPEIALRDLDLEPNARKTLEVFVGKTTS